MAKGYSYYLPIEQAKGKFYMRSHFTNNFGELTEERLQEIKKDADLFTRQKIEKYKLTTTFLRGSVSLYCDALFYLTSPSINFIYPTFDEKMAFLILVVDPECKIAKKYLQSTLLTPYEQKHLTATDEDKKQKHINERQRLFHQVENEFGFTDPQFVNFERVFFNRFGLQKELLSNIQGNYINELLDKTALIKSYEKTTDEEYQEAIRIAENLIVTQPDIANPNTVAFNILKQGKLIGANNTFRQAFLIFILTVDPDLNMLKIYLDESMVPRMMDRANEELGFYHRDLIRLEQEYHKRFTPDKIISEWQI